MCRGTRKAQPWSAHGLRFNVSFVLQLIIAPQYAVLVIAIGNGRLGGRLGFRAFAVLARAPAASLGHTQSCHSTCVARTEPVRLPGFINCDLLVQPTQPRSA